MEYEYEEVKCKKCKQPFNLPFGKTFKNCGECREAMTIERRNKPKYDPQTHRICRTCKEVKCINSDFLIKVEKKTNICAGCRDLPKPEKEEKEVDPNKVLSSVARTLEKLMLYEEVNEVMGYIIQRLDNVEGGEEEEYSDK